MNVLTIRQVRRPLDCRLIPDRRGSPLSDIRRWLRREPGVQLTTLNDPGELTRAGFGTPVVIWAIVGVPGHSHYREIVRLAGLPARLVVAGNRELVPFIGPLMLAGACCVVTDHLQCDKVAEVVRRARELQPVQLVDWREDLLQRLPWQ